MNDIINCVRLLSQIHYILNKEFFFEEPIDFNFFIENFTGSSWAFDPVSKKLIIISKEKFSSEEKLDNSEMSFKDRSDVFSVSNFGSNDEFTIFVIKYEDKSNYVLCCNHKRKYLTQDWWNAIK